MPGWVERTARRAFHRLPPAAAAHVEDALHAEIDVAGALRALPQRRRLTATASTKGGPALTIAAAAGVPVLARRCDRFSAMEVLEQHLDLVTAALAEHGVDCAVLEAATMRRRIVMVTGNQARAARAALAEHLAGQGGYVCAVQADGRAGRGHQGAALLDSRELMQASVLRVFTYRAAGSRLLSGPNLGCDVEFWPLSDRAPSARDHAGATATTGTTAAGAIAVAPRPNRWTDRLGPEQRRPAEAEVSGRFVPTFQGLLQPHLLDVHFPIDAVYTWVDGTDPVWRERQADAWKRTHPGRHHASAADPARYGFRDELRYSLRSLHEYAGWVRRIYVVTDRQTPAWLAAGDPRVVLVDHRDIFDDPRCLPTFNSHAIEARLHHIDGLSEHFLYMNDDVFFGRPVPPELFFHGNGLIKMFPTTSTVGLGPPSADDLPVVSAGKNNRALIESSTGRVVTQKFQHVAHPHRRSVLDRMEHEFADALATTARARFRSPADVSVLSSLGQSYAYALGLATEATLSYRYVDITQPNAALKMHRLLRRRDADVFCLNEVAARAREQQTVDHLVADFLAAYFPLPSAFERAVGSATSGRP